MVRRALMNAASQLYRTSRVTDAMSFIACSAGVFFERAICSRKCHVETSRREEEMGRQYFDTEESDSYHINKACRTMILIKRYNCSLRC